MTTYKQLEKEFERKVKELQDKICPHKKTKWMEQWWAIGIPQDIVSKYVLDVIK